MINYDFLFQAIAKNLPQSEVIESTSVAGPGFVNITLSNKWISKVKETSNGFVFLTPYLSAAILGIVFICAAYS